MSENWSREELKAAVIAYIEMRTKEENKTPFVKTHYYSELSKRFNRSDKAFEYRMQNISYIFYLLGRTWVTGLKPAKNVGAQTAKILEECIFEVEGRDQDGVAELEVQVLTYKTKKTLSQPLGIKEPSKNYSKVTRYARDPKVKAWVLKEACGVCEVCNSKSPFITSVGEPFLEVHHLKRLVDGGTDTITNAIALCPNCHREMHYGVNKVALTSSMYGKLGRLVKE